MKVSFNQSTCVDLKGDGKIHAFKPGFPVDLPKDIAVALIKSGQARAEKGSSAETAALKRS